MHPTLRSLLRVYDREGWSAAEKEAYLADKMGGNVRGVCLSIVCLGEDAAAVGDPRSLYHISHFVPPPQRCHHVLSKKVYTILASRNPEQLLADD